MLQPERDRSWQRSQTAGVVRQGLIEIIQECRADQQVIHEDGLLSHRRITTTKDRSARNVVVSLHATSVDELEALAVAERTVLDSTFSDTGTFVSFDHLATEQFEISGVLCIVVSSRPGSDRDQGFC